MTVQTFTYTGAEQTFVVPTGITSLACDVVGASGYNNSVYTGGRVQGALAVTAGNTVYIYVGGQSNWNGGGLGGNGSNGNGYVGGDASDVRYGGNALTNRKATAGGGGGGAAYEGAPRSGGSGGGGNGVTGTNSDGAGTTGGAGATTSANGNGGSGNNVYLGNTPGGAAGSGGGSNAQGVGGKGGVSAGSNVNYLGGGGGGGGWYAGGGGGAFQGGSDGAGGGGGSSDVSGLTGTSQALNYGYGNGVITLTYFLPSIQQTIIIA